ncbi:hypothetical protein OHC33_002116 [Knufia fluminis]|uniref:BTB domain-containing protein n=1 Tax=Knufia fluminis TaxID=191047 RepID=A0AAN8IB80_9EURO|nr:hypothetical protein OHC33_002116 [Knufia fluminis]
MATQNRRLVVQFQLLSTGQYGDFEIECRGHIFKVHKAIMSSASPFFKSAIDGPFKESRENKIDLCEDEPEIIARILILIYCGVYESEDITRGMVGMIPQFEGVTDRYAHAIGSCWRDAELAVKLYTTMKRYGFSKSYSDSLRLIFLKALYNERRFETPSQDEQDDKPLKESDAALLVDLVKLVYESTEEGDWTLKDVILQNIMGLIKDFRGLESEALQQMLRNSPDITLDIASSVLKETTCKECNHSIMIECRGHVFMAHKMILSKASEFFRGAIDNKMKESLQSKLDLPEDEPEIVARMLVFLYTRSSLRDCLSQFSQFKEVHDKYNDLHRYWYNDSKLFIKLYHIGDKYVIEDLKTAARRWFARIFTKPFPHHCEMRAKEPDTAKLLAELIQLAYSIVPAIDYGLKDIILQGMKEAFQEPQALEQEAYSTLLKDVPDFTLDMAMSALDRRSYACCECGSLVYPRLFRCACGRVEGCDRRICMEERARRSVCMDCGTLECLIWEDFSSQSIDAISEDSY